MSYFPQRYNPHKERFLGITAKPFVLLSLSLSNGEVRNFLHLSSLDLVLRLESHEQVSNSLIGQLYNGRTSVTQLLNCYRLANLNEGSDNVSLEALVLKLSFSRLLWGRLSIVKKLNLLVNESYHLSVVNNYLTNFCEHLTFCHTRHLFLFMFCFLYYVFIITYFFYFVNSFFIFFYFVFVDLAPYTTWLIVFLLAPYIHLHGAFCLTPIHLMSFPLLNFCIYYIISFLFCQQFFLFFF